MCYVKYGDEKKNRIGWILCHLHPLRNTPLGSTNHLLPNKYNYTFYVSTINNNVGVTTHSM